MDNDACTPKMMPKKVLDAASERRMVRALILFLLPILAIGVVAQQALGRPPAGAFVPLADLANAQIVEIRDHRGAVVLSGEFRARVDSLGNTERDAELTNQRGANVIGEIELELPAPGRDHLRPELEVDVIHLQPLQSYTVVIDDRAVGSFLTDDRGSADLELQEGETLPNRSRR
jgi:hypothetical protein